MNTTIGIEKESTLNNGAMLLSVPFHIYFCQSLILQISEFLYFAGTNYFLGLVNLVFPSGNLFINKVLHSTIPL